MERRSLLAWTALAVALAALRLPMLLLPGLGRDEAAYVYWSHHPEPAYAPLLQILVALGRGLPTILEARLPSVLAGALVLGLFARLLAQRGMVLRDRWIAVALVGLCPWQTYAGTILHPDDLQLAAVLGFVVAAGDRRAWWAVVIAGLAPWTKPSGALVVVVAAVWILRGGFVGRARAAAWALLFALALPPLFAMDPPLLRGLLAFGSSDADLFRRVSAFVLGSVVLAGPALPLVGLRGVVELRNGSRDLGKHLGLLFVIAFGAAAVVTGQVKGNWMLPAILLLWPHTMTWRAPTAGVALLTTALLSAALTISFVRVDWSRAVEERWVELPSYLMVAGEREADVASASAWWHRPAEYRPVEFSCPDGLEVVVSDDYGLASQWILSCPNPVPRLVLPLDPVFHDPGATIPRGAIVLAVRHEVADLIAERAWEPMDPVAHPITGAPIQRARVTDDSPAFERSEP